MSDPEDGTDAATSMTMDEATKAYASTLTAEEPKGQTDATDDLATEAEDDELPADEVGEDEDEGETEDEGQAEDEDEEPVEGQTDADDPLAVEAEDDDSPTGEDDDEGETEDEGQAEDEDEEPESDQGRFVSPNGKVRLPDGSVVPVSELINGNLRDRDYRQKTMEAAEVRKSFEAQSEAVKQRETQLVEQAEYVSNLLKTIVPGAPDPALLTTDPMGYMTQKANHEQWMNHIAFLEQQTQQVTQTRQADAATKERETVEKEWAALVEKAPDLKDEKRLNRFAEDLKTHGVFYGFTPEELKARIPLDHRQALVLRDAIKWRKLQANKASVPAKVEGRPPVQRGGQRLDPQKTQARNSRAAMERLNSSGSLKDGIAALLAIEKG